MSSTNFMKKLLNGVEVEWKPLEKVVRTLTAPAKLKSDAYRATGKIPIIDQGIEFIAGYTDEDIAFVETDGCIIFGDHSEHIKYVDFAFIQGADGIKILTPVSDNAKYIYYAFQNFYKKKLSYKRHWSTAKETLIPILCPEKPEKSLEIQAEIVRILDTFTELTAELIAELTARKKQYTHYRDLLLSFEEREVEWKTLGDIYKFQYGMGNTIPTLGGEYPVYGSNGIVGTHNEFNSEDSPVIGHIGAYAGIVNWGAGKHYVTYNGVICKLINELVHPKYAYYQLLKQDFNSMAKSASHPFISYDALNKVLIPIPSPAEQARIVANLEKFDTLTSSISEGLPREIVLRQKQYEYYRNLLFSFPKPEEIAA
jgi:type I restriction enzyme S subunit